MDEVSVTFECPRCGATEISLPDDYNDESEARCKGCDVSFGSYGEIKKRAAAKVKDSVLATLRKSFRR